MSNREEEPRVGISSPETSTDQQEGSASEGATVVDPGNASDQQEEDSVRKKMYFGSVPSLLETPKERVTMGPLCSWAVPTVNPLEAGPGVHMATVRLQKRFLKERKMEVVRLIDEGRGSELAGYTRIF